MLGFVSFLLLSIITLLVIALLFVMMMILYANVAVARFTLPLLAKHAVSGAWLSWWQVKRLTKASTRKTIFLLMILASPKGPLECRFRDVAVQNRLRRHLRRPISQPEQTRPVNTDEVLLFEFRVRPQNRRRKWSKNSRTSPSFGWKPA